MHVNKELSKELWELGVRVKSEYSWSKNIFGKWKIYKTCKDLEFTSMFKNAEYYGESKSVRSKASAYPALMLGELMRVLPGYKNGIYLVFGLEKNISGYHAVAKDGSGEGLYSYNEYNPEDATAQLLIWLIKEGYVDVKE